MNPRDLAKLKELRERREMSARERLAEENERLRRREAAAAEAIARAKSLESEVRERNRAAVADMLEDRATPLRFARLELQHRIGQEALLGALRQAASENRSVNEQRARAEAARTDWSGAAKTLRKVDLLIEAQAAQTASEPEEASDR